MFVERREQARLLLLNGGRRASITALLGRNGAGKTTTLCMVAGPAAHLAERIEDLLSTLALTSLADRRVGGFSQGERMKVGRRKASFIASVLVTVVIGAGVIARAMTSGSTLEIAVAIEAWLFIAIVWTVTIRIDRHNWRPLGNTTTAFVDLSIRRCESDLKGLRAAVVLFIAQFMALVALKQSLAPVGLLELRRQLLED